MHVAPSIQLNPLLACLEDSSNVLARFAYKQPLVLQIGKIDLFSAMPTYADPSRGDPTTPPSSSSCPKVTVFVVSSSLYE